jgi:hypothetical protein
MGSGEGRGRSRGGPSPPLRVAPDPLRAAPGKSTVGRPRALTDRQIEVILAEQVRFLAWRALRQTVKSQRQLAREFGVSQATISLAVRSKGDYKQPSPERRAATLAARRAQRRRIW